MARRVAAVLLLLALGCLLGILLLCLGSGDTRGPPGFKVSGAGTGDNGHRRDLGCWGWGSRSGHPHLRDGRGGTDSCSPGIPSGGDTGLGVPALLPELGVQGAAPRLQGHPAPPPQTYVRERNLLGTLYQSSGVSGCVPSRPEQPCQHLLPCVWGWGTLGTQHRPARRVPAALPQPALPDEKCTSL